MHYNFPRFQPGFVLSVLSLESTCEEKILIAILVVIKSLLSQTWWNCFTGIKIRRESDRKICGDTNEWLHHVKKENMRILFVMLQRASTDVIISLFAHDAARQCARNGDKFGRIDVGTHNYFYLHANRNETSNEKQKTMLLVLANKLLSNSLASR